MPRGKSCILEATPVPFHKNDAILMSVEEDMTIMAMVEEMTTVVAGTNDSAQLQIWIEKRRRQENECVGKKRSQRSQKLMQLFDLKAKDV
ncbi:hypothetical protein YC2023_083969 [Brassica napus]